MTEMLLTVGARVNWRPAALLAAGVPAETVLAAAAAVIVAGCHAQIDEIADRVYTPSASRSARYVRKEAEARAYLAEVSPDAEDYPMLAAESLARSVTLTALAESVVAAADAYTQLAAAVEAARASARIAIEGAASIEAMRAAAASAIAGVEALVAG
jgi:hypothetical protein